MNLPLILPDVTDSEAVVGVAPNWWPVCPSLSICRKAWRGFSASIGMAWYPQHAVEAETRSSTPT